jgi:hypothetical protein
LDLADTLLTRAEKSAEAEIPVLFNLSSWKEDKQEIADWMLGELCQKYTVGRELGQGWITQQILLPLLDGLDELEPKRQELCVKRINDWLQSGRGPGMLVVCSRIEEYENYETELALGGAICLQLLDDGQIEGYLQAVGKPELRAAVAEDQELRTLVRVPLQMSMAVLVYDEAFGAAWREQETEAGRLSLLLEAYVGYMLRRPLENSSYGTGKPPTEAETRQWLIWLAKQLKAESKDEFLIEQMQPSLVGISNRRRTHTRSHKRVSYKLGRIYQLITGLTYGFFGIFLGFFLGGFLKEFWSILSGPIIGFSFCFIMGLDTGTEKEITPFEAFDLSFSSFTRKTFLRRLIHRAGFVFCCWLIGGVLGLTAWQVKWTTGASIGIGFALNTALFFGLFGLLVDGIIGGLISGCKKDITIRKDPNQGILQSLKNASMLTLTAIATAYLLRIPITVIIGQGLKSNLIDGIINLSQAILIYYVFVQTGGKACVQHFALRVVLHHSGAIPRNYAKFLNYSTERLLLQCVGGRYRFIHKRLQDHFAAMP